MKARANHVLPLPDHGALAALLAAGIIAAAPHALELSPWVIAIFAGGAAWRYGAEMRGWYRPGRIARLLLVAVVVAATFRQFHTLFGRDAGLTLLLGLLGLKFLELRQARDYVVTLFLFYLVTLGSFLYGQTLGLGAYAVIAVLANTAALVRVTQPRGLALRANLKLAALLLAKAVPLMLILYFLFPRIQGALWSMPGEAGTATTGLSDTMQPGSIRQLTESNDVAFHATFDGKPPAAGELYWRSLVLWDTDGKRWARGHVPGRDVLEPTGRPVHYEIMLEPTRRPWMVALELPADAPPKAIVQAGFTFVSRDTVDERTRYALTSYLHHRAGELDARERSAALALPPTLSPRVRALAQRWRAERHGPGAVVQAALDYFHRENFVYTLSPPPLGDDPVDEFLFGTRRGFCEHYASAFVTLMRAAGVPARVVVGYQGGEYNASGNYFIVRQSDAHAWAEVWLAQSGWTRVDPTAAVAPERIEFGMDAIRRLAAQGTALGTVPVGDVLERIAPGLAERLWVHSRLYWDLVNLSWYRWVADYGPERQARLLEALGLEQFSGRMLVLLAAAAVAAVLGGYALWLQRGRPAVDPVQAQYLRFCRKLARVGLARAPHEAPGDFARRCAARRPDLAQQVGGITTAYVRARYGDAPDQHRVERLRRAVGAFRPRRAT